MALWAPLLSLELQAAVQQVSGITRLGTSGGGYRSNRSLMEAWAKHLYAAWNCNLADVASPSGIPQLFKHGYAVLCLTREDQTGQSSINVWRGLLERYREEALGASLLAVYSVWQLKASTTLDGKKLVDRSAMLGSLPNAAREILLVQSKNAFQA